MTTFNFMEIRVYALYPLYHQLNILCGRPPSMNIHSKSIIWLPSHPPAKRWLRILIKVLVDIGKISLWKTNSFTHNSSVSGRQQTDKKTPKNTTFERYSESISSTSTTSPTSSTSCVRLPSLPSTSLDLGYGLAIIYNFILMMWQCFNFTFAEERFGAVTRVPPPFSPHFFVDCHW